MYFRQDESGVNRLGLLFFLSIVGAVVYAGSQVLPYYYNYYEIVCVMEEQGRKASGFKDDEITKTILQRVKKLNIPLETTDDLKINRFNGQIQIDMKYEESFDIPIGTEEDGETKYFHIHTFKFNPHVEQNF